MSSSTELNSMPQKLFLGGGAGGVILGNATNLVTYQGKGNFLETGTTGNSHLHVQKTQIPNIVVSQPSKSDSIKKKQ